MPLPRECTSLADGALTIHAVADRPGYFPGQAVQAQVTLVGGPEAVVVQQISACCSGHERLDPSWVAPTASTRGDTDANLPKGERTVFCTRDATLLAGCTLAAHECRSFSLQFTLPVTQPPTFRGTAARFWTQIVVSASLNSPTTSAGTLTLPLRVWPSSGAVARRAVPPSVVDVHTWEAPSEDGMPAARALSIGASDFASPLFGMPPASNTPRRATSAAPSPLAMEAGDDASEARQRNGHHTAALQDRPRARVSMDLDDGHGTPLAKGSRQNADVLSPLGSMSAVRCATYAIRFGDVPLMRISVVPPGPTAVCGTPLEGTLDFEAALGGDIVSLAAAGGSTHAAGMHNVRVTAVAISLDTLESVAPEACTRGAQGRVVRRVRDEMWEATGDTARCTFAFHMPQDATPSFDNGVVRLAWQLEFVFTLDHGVRTGQPQQLKWSLPLTVVPCN